MLWNKRLLKNVKLYLILDAEVIPYPALLNVLKASVRLGVDGVQLRDKHGSARDILAFCRRAIAVTRRQVPFILNDRVDLAALAKTDGVHLGQEDIPCAMARSWVGKEAIVGVSCQNWAQAKKARQEGADYIGFGSVFKTLTKPQRSPMDLQLLKKVFHSLDIPVFPIGGICRDNIGQLIDLQIDRTAVCRDILLAHDPGKAARTLKMNLLGRTL